MNYRDPYLRSYIDPALYTTPDYERYRNEYIPDLRAAYQLMQMPTQNADDYRAAAELMQMSQGRQGFGDEHDEFNPPSIVRQNAERRLAPDPDSIMHEFKMSFGKAKKTKKPRKAKPKKVSLKQLQNIARDNGVSIFTRRKDGKGFTKKPLTVKALKSRLSRKKVPYRGGRKLGPLARPDDGFLLTPFRPGM